MKTDLKQKLFDLEPGTPMRREQYETAMSQLFDRRLTRFDIVRLTLMGVGGLVGAMLCGFLVTTEPASMPTRTRVALMVLGAIGLTWMSLAAVIVRRMSINSAVHGAFAARAGFIFSLLATVGIALLNLSSDKPAAVAGLVLLPIATLILATVVLVVHELRQSELRVRRGMLEAELRRFSMPEA